MITNSKNSLANIKGKRKALNAQTYHEVKVSRVSLKGQSYGLIQPAGTPPKLALWAANNTAQIHQSLNDNGAVLFRGFDDLSRDGFEAFAEAVCEHVINDNAEHNRTSVSGKVYTPVVYPAEKKILWHNENSYNQQWPLKIIFGSQLAAEQGGATPIVDSRKVLQFLRPELVKEFTAKGVMYVRTYDGRMGNSWQQVFQTDDKQTAEQKCIEQQMSFRWLDEQRLQTRAVRPAVTAHPVSGELSWFNQAQHWHTQCLDDKVRQALLKLCEFDELPRQCFFGDGSVISDAVMAEICQVYQALEISFCWQNNDVMLVDNVMMAHARNPYVGDRKLLVSMGDLCGFDDCAALEVQHG